MTKFNVVIEPVALSDIQEAIDYYDSQEIGLGEEFENKLNQYLVKLRLNPFYQTRYDDVHCLPLKRFPYMIHFSIEEESNLVNVRAVLNTARNPNIWKGRKGI